MKKLLLILYVLIFASIQASAQKSGKDSYAYLRGVEAFEQENYQEAGKYFYQALQDDEENGYAYGYIARIFHLIERRALALTSYKDALRYVPQKDKEFLAKIHSWRADTYWALSDTARAYDEMCIATQLDPKCSDHFLTRGILSHRKKDYAAALADYQAALALDTANNSVRCYMSQTLAAQKDWPQVIKVCREATLRDSTLWSIYLESSKAHYRLGQIAEAANDLATSYHFGGFDPEVVSWADTLAQQDYTATQQALSQALKRWKDDSDFYYALSSAAQSTFRYATALDQADKYVKTKDGDQYLYYTSIIKHFMYHFDDALIDIRRAYKADSTDTSVAIAYAMELESVDSCQEALTYLNNAIAAAPLNAEGYAERQFVYRQLGNYAAALDDAQHYLALSPDDATAQMSVGYILHHMGRTDEALPYLREAARLDSVPLGSQVRAFALFFQGKTAEAIDWCSKMVEAEEVRMQKGQMAQPNEMTYYRVARIYAVAGNKEEALRYLRLALQYNFRTVVFISKCKDFNSLHGDADFEALIKEYMEKPTTWK